MTPWDLIVWALALAAAILIVGIAVALTWAILQSARVNRPSTPVYSSKSHQ